MEHQLIQHLCRAPPKQRYQKLVMQITGRLACCTKGISKVLSVSMKSSSLQPRHCAAWNTLQLNVATRETSFY